MDKKLNLYQVWGSVKSYSYDFYVIAEDPTSALKKVQERVESWDQYNDFGLHHIDFIAKSDGIAYQDLLVL